MATTLFLNGQQVYPASGQTIKLTRENPYFTESESYTLDVTLPMGILENRQALGPLQRIDCSKRPPHMTARLAADNRTVLKGTARVVQVTQDSVRVQLLGGRSEINFLSADDHTYIDEIDMGRAGLLSLDAPGCVWVPAWDETNGTYVNNEGLASLYGGAPQPRLLDVMRCVMKHYGYVYGDMSLRRDPWDSLYVASAKKTDYPAHTLPHWLVRDFITEFCHFFNVTLVVDQEARTAVVVPNAEYFDTLRALTISPVDDYQADLSDDGEAHALAADNLRFDLSGSDCHDYDVIGDALRQSLPSVAYGSRTAARQAFEAMDERQQMAQLFTCPDGRLAGWDHDYSDIGGGTRRMLTQVDVFGPLVRDPQSDSETLLKIVPVAISDSETLPYSEQLLPDDSPRMSQSTCRMPSLENPTGHEHIAKAGGDEDQEQPTMQDYISGEASIEQAEKEDRLQVMFVDSVLQTSVVIGGDWAGEEFARMMGFTDHQYKKNHKGNDHRRWSLSLNPTDADHYLGQLHQLGFTFNMKARHCFKFLAEEMPDPTRVYNVRGKLYGCEKIEANLTEDGLDRLMTGYFYEMTDRAQL